MLEHLLKEYHRLITEHESIVTRLNSIAQSIKAYGGDAATFDELGKADLASVISTVRESLYPENGTWGDKALYALRTFGYPASATEIFEYIRKVEPIKMNVEQGRYVQSYANALASTCSRMAKDGTLSVDQSSSPYKYSIPE